MRRTSRKHSEQIDCPIAIWPSIIPLWLQWIEHLTVIAFQPNTLLSSPPSAAFVDASDKGYGLVVTLGSTFHIVGNSWTVKERELHINVKEALAVKKLVFFPHEPVHNEVALPDFC